MSSLDFLALRAQRPADATDLPVVLLVTPDPAMRDRLIGALLESVSASQPGSAPEPRALSEAEGSGRGTPYHLPLVSSLAQARSRLGRALPLVIFLDDRVADPGAFEEALQSFSHFAPLVVLIGPEFLARLSASPFLRELVSCGRMECVVRTGELALGESLLVRLIERHASRLRSQNGSSASAAAADAVDRSSDAASRGFGEMLRHEVNNPLTGILGNAELLLSRSDHLPPDMVERLATIADLAIRLRETVRRLSNEWDQRAGHAASPPAEPACGERSRTMPLPRGVRRAC